MKTSKEIGFFLSSDLQMLLYIKNKYLVLKSGLQRAYFKGLVPRPRCIVPHWQEVEPSTDRPIENQGTKICALG